LNGQGVKEIAEYFGFCQYSVLQKLKHIGVKTRPRGRQRYDTSNNTLIKLRKQGLTYKQIAEKLGTSDFFVISRLNY